MIPAVVRAKRKRRQNAAIATDLAARNVDLATALNAVFGARERDKCSTAPLLAACTLLVRTASATVNAPYATDAG